MLWNAFGGFLPLVKKQMVFLMKNTASGAMSMESLHIVAWMI